MKQLTCRDISLGNLFIVLPFSLVLLMLFVHKLTIQISIIITNFNYKLKNLNQRRQMYKKNTYNTGGSKVLQYL